MVRLEKIKTNPRFSKQLENKILYVEHDQDMSIQYESTYTLKYVIKGEKCYNYNNQRVKVLENQYLILNNNECIHTEALKGTRGLSFFLSPTAIAEANEFYSANNTPLEFFEWTQKNTNDPIGNCLHRMTKLLENDPLNFDYHKDELFIHLIKTFLEQQANIHTKFASLSIVKQSTRAELFKLVNQTKEYLNEKFAEHITLDTISRDIGMSKYYLHRLFSEIIGHTPLEYLTRVRIERAKNMLLYSKNSISEIALQCGFESAPYFSHSFKKHTRVSPSQYRALSK